VPSNTPYQYKFGDFCVDPQSNRLIGAEAESTLEPKVMRLLCRFCEHPGQTLSKDELLDAVWGSAHFDDSVVARAVSILRRALGDDRHDPSFIRTVSRQGYQWLPAVRREGPSVAPAPTDGAVNSDIQSPPSAGVPTDAGSPHWRLPVFAAGLVAAVIIFVTAAWSLRSPAPVQPLEAGRPQSIAIMPFDIAQVPEDERYLPESLREEIAIHLTRLAQPRIYLLPQSDVAPGKEFIQARTIGADAVLLGDVSLVNDQLRLNLRLQDSRTSELLWVDMVQSNVSDLMPMRDRVIIALRRQLDMPEPFSLMNSSPTTLTNAQTYQTWLKARWLWRQRSFADLARGHELFSQVVEQAPDHADAHAWWAMSELLQVNYMLESPTVGYPRAAQAARRALSREPDNAYALLAMAQVHLQQDLHLAEAESMARRSVKSAAGLAENRQFLAEVLSMQNKHQEALHWIDSALQIEPYSALLQGVHGILLTTAGQTERAIVVFEELERYTPKFNWHHRYYGYALMRQGRGADAAREMLEASSTAPTGDERRLLIQAIDDSDGQAYWTKLAEQLQPEPLRKTGHHYFLHLETLAASGRLDEAMTWLVPMLKLRSESFLVLRISPALDPLRQREDYRQVLRSMNIPIYSPDS